MMKLEERYVLSEKGKKNVLTAALLLTLVRLCALIPLFLISLLSEKILKVKGNTAGDGMSLGFLGILIIGFIFFVAYIFLIRLQYRKANLPTYEENERLRFQLADKLLSVSLSAMNKKGLAELSLNMIGDTNANEKILSGILPSLLSAMIFFPVAAVLTALVDPVTAIAIFAPIPLALIVLMLTMREQEKRTMNHIPIKRAATTALHEYVEGLYEIRTNGMLKKKLKDLDELLEKNKKYSARMELFSGVCVAASDVLLQLGTGVGLVLIIMRVRSGHLGVMQTVFLITVILTIYGIASEVMSEIPSGMYFRKVTERMKHLLASEELSGDKSIWNLTDSVQKTSSISKIGLRFENVGFSYQTGKKAVHHINLSLGPGKVTALVGPSGCGKTTLANLAARMWDPQEGVIRLEGIDIRTLSQESYYQNISCVFQDTILFKGSVLDNIRLGRPDATDEEVKKAAALAYCDLFVEKLPDGWNTELTENGSSLSEGERQRISIARAILKNAPILILDEATSHLDAENEFLVQKAISSVMKEKTVLIIAHRLRNIVHADQIAMMEAGEIIAQGKHEDLIKISLSYRKLYELQEESIRWTIDQNNDLHS